MNGSVALSSDELNFVVYRYLMESGGPRSSIQPPLLPRPPLVQTSCH